MTKLIKNIIQFFTASIQRQLMLGIIFVHALLMTIFVFDLVDRQQDFLHNQSIEQAKSLTDTLAANSIPWILSDDIVGLEEILESQQNYPDLKYAMLISPEGRILAHSNHEKTGLYLADEISLSLINKEHKQFAMIDTNILIDVASPINVNDNFIGWARVGLGQEKITLGLEKITINGLSYTLLAIFVGSIFAYLMGKSITRGLTHLVNVADKIKTGDISSRSTLRRNDELGNLSEDFNLMMDTIHKAQNELSEILNYMVHGVISIDEKGCVINFNQAAESLFGYKPHQVIGNNISMLMPKSTSKNHDEYLKNYLDTGNAKVIGFGRNVEGLKQNNQRFPMRLSVSELPIADNGVRRFIGICEDLTMAKQQEEQLLRSQKMAAMGNLTSGIAHDYNNMLSVVMGYSSILESKLVDYPKLAEYANQINHAGERGAQLTKKLLSFSKKQAIEPEEVQINNVLEQQKDLLQKTLTVGIALYFDLNDQLWTTWVDKGELEDVILNLSINALQAMDIKETASKLTIRTANKNINGIDSQVLDLDSGDYVQLSFTDTGVGMTEDVKERIFEPFFTTKGKKGSGLGLSQVFGFVERSGGNIKVFSELDYGSQFVLYFPRCNKIKNEDTVEVLTEDYTNLRGHENILVVDDEGALLSLTSELLSEQGYNVFGAINGKEALEILAKEKIDFVLSDIIMPDMDGYQLSAHIKKNYPLIKIQLASGYADEQNKKMVNEKLHDQMLHKPYNSQELFFKIRTLLDT